MDCKLSHLQEPSVYIMIAPQFIVIDKLNELLEAKWF